MAIKVQRVFSKEECQNLNYSLNQEWLETNGLGGFASNTIINCATRKYHSLLVAPLPQIGDRFNLLNNIDESLKIGKDNISLSTNKYPGIFDPKGYEYIDHVSIGLCYKAVYKVKGIALSKSILMVYGQNTVLIKYDVLDLGSNKSFVLSLRPLISFRDFHALMKNNTSIQVRTFTENGKYIIDPYEGMTPLYFSFNQKPQFFPGPDWFHNFEYQKEQERGYDFHEDLFCPGVFEKKLGANNSSLLIAATLEPNLKNLDKLWNEEIQHRLAEREFYKDEEETLGALKTSARHFLIKNHRGETSIIAGYPWFGEWGRDSMIALPGLTFYSGRVKSGFEVIRTFAKYEKDGLLPNYLTTDDAAYNSIDAALLFFWAIQEYLKISDNWSGVIDEFYETLKRMISAYIDNKVPHVNFKKNGLIWAGHSGTQLTWMDATAWGKPVTSRHGLAVDINALWFNALSFFIQLSEKAGKSIDLEWTDIRDKCGEAIEREFWLEEDGYLADVINENGKDKSLRPNQVFAVSLPFSALSLDKKKNIIKRVDKDLVTDYGLKTLANFDPSYKGKYQGSQDERDSAYHQGTVWPWLIGHFVEGYLKTASGADELSKAKSYLKDRFRPLYTEHLKEFGVLGISEIFSGDPPHHADGCINQAWSVAELIRSLELLK